jgi:asparagine synthase (glutamine-hydrolysing)
LCGICGEFNYDGPKEDAESRVRQMASMLSHRGPDGEGFYVDEKVALGHKRLSIIDLSLKASQPMFSSSKRYVLIYNGEIYNFEEIKENLIKKGEKFETKSDSEVLLKSYEVWGIDFINKLNGMWAFAIYDRVKKELILSRDRIGKKPLYFSKTKRGIVFSSEIYPLLLSKDVKKEVDLKTLAEQIACRYAIAPKTLLKSVKKIPPGHILIVNDRGSKLFPYYKIPLENEIGETGEDVVEKFSERFLKSVERRLISDVPLGVLLSGGLDSSSIVCAMRKLNVGDIETFTVGFEDGGNFDERKYAKNVAQLYKTNHTDFLISAKTFIEGLPDVLKHQDDPVCDFAILPLYYLCKEAKGKVKVLLSGQGADEVVGGYHLDRVLRQIKAIAILNKIPFIGPLAKIYSKFDKKRQYLSKWNDFKGIDEKLIPARMRYDLTMPLSYELMSKLFKEKIEPPYDRTLDAFYSENPPFRGAIDSILGTLLKGWLPDNLLNHGDRMSMANSIEMRCPFLDYELIDFCFRIKEGMKSSTKETKIILKKWALLNEIPKEIVFRKKKGFPVPFKKWLKGEIHNKVKERVLSTGWFEEFFNLNEIENLLKESLRGRDHSLLLFNFLILSHWGENIGL